MHSAPATRPALEVADIVRACDTAFRAEHWVSGPQDRVLRALLECRTAALGGHKAQCDSCGHVTIQYSSCRNRHCPKCQTLAATRWVERQGAHLLDIDYWHVVFTLPHELNPLAQTHPRLLYNLLFHCASRTLLEFGRNPRWLGGEIGFTMVLHTWGQNLSQHIHVHCVVTGGALSPDRQRWIPARRGFLFPTKALSKVFRGKYLEALTQAHRKGDLRGAGDVDQGRHDADAFDALVTRLRTHDWVVYAKPPFAGVGKVLAYLGRYTHRVAISNHRLLDFDGERVRFRWRDYAHGNKQKIMSLTSTEFVRRFLLHTLPRGFARIRHFGLLANRLRHQRLAHCRTLIGQCTPQAPTPETVDAMMLRLTGIDITRCPRCHQGRLLRAADTAPSIARPPTPRATGPPH